MCSWSDTALAGSVGSWPGSGMSGVVNTTGWSVPGQTGRGGERGRMFVSYLVKVGL